jgi:hypothetical protein
VVPDIKFALIELVMDEPAVTDLSPELEREKLNGWLTVNEALASALGLCPVLKAFVVTKALFVSVKGPV